MFKRKEQKKDNRSGEYILIFDNLNTEEIKEKFQEYGVRKSYFLFLDDERQADELYDTFKEKEYKINFINFKNPKYTNFYNPLLYLMDDDDIIKFSDFLSSYFNFTGNEGSVLTAFIMYLINYRPMEEKNMLSVYKLIDAGKIDHSFKDMRTAADRIFDEVYRRDPNSKACLFYDITRFSDTQIKEKVYLNLLEKFSFIRRDDLAPFLMRNDFGLDEIETEKNVVFVIKDKRFTFFQEVLKYQVEEFVNKERHISNKFCDFYVPAKIEEIEEKRKAMRLAEEEEKKKQELERQVTFNLKQKEKILKEVESIEIDMDELKAKVFRQNMKKIAKKK